MEAGSRRPVSDCRRGGGTGRSLLNHHEQAQFCGTCRIMDPYLESWNGSDPLAYDHAEEGVTCLERHDPTLQQQMQELEVYVRGEFTVPRKEREFRVEFCLGCHDAGTFEKCSACHQ